MRLRDKIALGLICTTIPLAATDFVLSLHTEQKANDALTQEARHAFVLEDQLNSSVSVRYLVQNPETLQNYIAVQQEYNDLMANPEVQQSIEESKNYTDAWYYSKGRQRADIFWIGGMLMAGGAAFMGYRQKKKKKELEAKLQESGQ